MINGLNSVNMYQPKKVTIETKPFTGIDEGAPYQGTEILVTEEKPNGEQKVWADYALTQPTEKEFENLTKTIASIYAQQSYSQAPSTDEKYTPIPGKDFYV